MKGNFSKTSKFLVSNFSKSYWNKFRIYQSKANNSFNLSHLLVKYSFRFNRKKSLFMKTMRNLKPLFLYFCKNMKNTFLKMMKKRIFKFKNQFMKNLHKNQPILLMFWFKFKIKTLITNLMDQQNYKNQSRKSKVKSRVNFWRARWNKIFLNQLNASTTNNSRRTYQTKCYKIFWSFSRKKS